MLKRQTLMATELLQGQKNSAQIKDLLGQVV